MTAWTFRLIFQLEKTERDKIFLVTRYVPLLQHRALTRFTELFSSKSAMGSYLTFDEIRQTYATCSRIRIRRRCQSVKCVVLVSGPWHALAGSARYSGAVSGPSRHETCAQDECGYCRIGTPPRLLSMRAFHSAGPV